MTSARQDSIPFSDAPASLVPSELFEETAWGRALRDAERVRESARFFWGAEVIGAAFLSYLGARMPGDDSVGGLVGFITGLALVYTAIVTWQLLRAPFRQRDEARVRLAATSAAPPVLLEPSPDGGPAYLRVTNHGPAGIFRARMLDSYGQEHYLGWNDEQDEVLHRDRQLLTGETAMLLVAVLRRRGWDEFLKASWPNFSLWFFEAGRADYRRGSGVVDGDREPVRVTVMNEHAAPAIIDLVVGADLKPASWDASQVEGAVVLERGEFVAYEVVSESNGITPPNGR